MHAVIIQVQPAKCVIIPDMRQLRGVDLVKSGQRTVPYQKIAPDLAQAGRMGGIDQSGHLVRAQIGIAATGNDQMTI